MPNANANANANVSVLVRAHHLRGVNAAKLCYMPAHENKIGFLAIFSLVFFWSFGVKMWWGTIGIAENGTMTVTLISTIWDHYKAHEEQSCVLSLSVASQD